MFELLQSVSQQLTSDVEFLRAIDFDANQLLHFKKIKKPLLIWNNLGQIDYTVNDVGLNHAEYQVNILFVNLDQLDSTTEEQEAIRDQMTALANEYYSILIRQDEFSTLTQYPNYQIITEVTKIYDQTLTGVALNVDVMLDTALCLKTKKAIAGNNSLQAIAGNNLEQAINAND